MQIQENISLRQYNTLGIDAKARYFSSFTSVDELQELLDYSKTAQARPLVLGGGSNILFTGDYNGLVMKNAIPGLELIREDDQHVYLRAGAGEQWHALTQYCIQHNWAGVENLSLIPGSAGAAPMQNIGAYGVEIKDVFEELQAFHVHDKQLYSFSKADCEFGYRESVFKGRYRNQFVIVNITLRLNRQPVFHTSYGAINQELQRMGVQELSIAAIAQAVINIRRSKLPDPATTGNAGSFFKNPSVSREFFQTLKQTYPDIVAYDNPDGTVKLAAGWLIEHCGPEGEPGVSSWKGYRKGDVGCHAQQALVLVNYGKAGGKEIYTFSEAIAQSVQAKFGVQLEREVNVV